MPDKPTNTTPIFRPHLTHYEGCESVHPGCAYKAAERRIVEWLRAEQATRIAQADEVNAEFLRVEGEAAGFYADAIERGEHRG